MGEQKFNGDGSIETGIHRLVHLSHAARPEQGDNPVRADLLPNQRTNLLFDQPLGGRMQGIACQEPFGFGFEKIRGTQSPGADLRLRRWQLE